MGIVYNHRAHRVNLVLYFTELSKSISLASGLGLEPRLLGPEPSVLPLDDPELFKEASCLVTSGDPETFILLTS